MIYSNHWQGKLWYAYGTSMTSVAMGKYVPVVEKLSGMKVVNLGIPGGSISPEGYGKGNVKRAIMTLDDKKTDADLITVEVLPNESGRIGDIFDTDDESFCGCFNQCIRYLQENTRAQIVVIIMIGGNDHEPEFHACGRSISNFEFAEIIERVAHLNGVPTINVFAESGLGYARVKAHEYQPDNIHLNERGGRIMGNFVWSKLSAIPVWEYGDTNGDAPEATDSLSNLLNSEAKRKTPFIDEFIKHATEKNAKDGNKNT